MGYFCCIYILNSTHPKHSRPLKTVSACPRCTLLPGLDYLLAPGLAPRVSTPKKDDTAQGSLLTRATFMINHTVAYLGLLAQSLQHFFPLRHYFFCRFKNA